MLNNLISSVIAFLLAVIPTFSNVDNNLTNNHTTILFTGDIMLGRSVMGASLDNNDPLYPFRNTADFLKDADITFGNLENPIVTDCKRHSGGFKFCTSSEIAQGLRYSGFDVVSLANNHTSNYGKDGIEETKRYLSEMGIKSVGYGNLEVVEKNNIKFGFLGFDYVTSQINLDRDLALIAGSEPAVDILIVSPHWGTEYKAVASSMQEVVSKKMVEKGADIIIGHHPHWAQNFEKIGSVPVYYSLGNFVFDQMWSEETKKGLVVMMTFENKDLIKTEEFKTYTPKIGQPIIIDESPKE